MHAASYAERAPLESFVARGGGWLLISLCALYEALDDESYLEHARRVVGGLRQWIDRGARKGLPPAGCVHTPVHLFIALTGVAGYWRLTGDDLARETLLVGGELVLSKGRNEAGFFFVSDGPAYRHTGRWPTCHSLAVMRELYEITGERRWLEAGMHQARLMLRMIEAETQWGKEANWAQGGIYFAYAFCFFEAARRAGLLKDLGE